jgi:hypothetical protein
VLARRALARLVLMILGAVCARPALSYEPKVNFQLNCMGCHLADGSGSPGRVPSLRRSLVELSAFAAGRDYIIRVPGVAQSPLSNDELAALLNWMARNLSDLAPPADFTDYSADEIERSRTHPLAAVKATRARLLRSAAASSASKGR